MGIIFKNFLMSQYIQIQNLTRTYKMSKKVEVEALRGVNLEIARGEMVSIVGSSGSGKSTLLNILGGLDWDFEGSVVIDGKNIKKYNPNYYRRYIVGTVFQQFYLIPTLNVEENILLPKRFERKGYDKKELDKLIDMVGLSDRRRHMPSELSGGQAQRVAIARALVDNPKIILADEPTGNLDSVTGQSIMDLLKDISKRDEVTIIVVTHDPQVAKQTARSITLKDGQNV